MYTKLNEDFVASNRTAHCTGGSVAEDHTEVTSDCGVRRLHLHQDCPVGVEEAVDADLHDESH
jgi:hypothetical protein